MGEIGRLGHLGVGWGSEVEFLVYESFMH